MFKRLRRAWQAHVLFKSRIPFALWQRTVSLAPTIGRLPDADQHRLRKLASVFLHEKTISFVEPVDDEPFVRVFIAAQACLLILNMDLDCFDGWSEVIVYPGTFVVTREEIDEFGVSHRTKRSLAGESWQRGPVVLSWEDANPSTPHHSTGANVILHEFAHKLDMLNGSADGFPPLHQDMPIAEWTRILTNAFETLNHRLAKHHSSLINPYAATHPAEFFAVLTEVFFEQPRRLSEGYPDLYDQLRGYYRQDPARQDATREDVR